MKNFRARSWFVPQAVIVIGTYDENGTPNAMNAAWAGTWDEDKIVISLGSHQTTDNLKRTPELTVGFATRETMVAADYVGLVSGRKVKDKVARTGWTVKKAEHVDAPLFAELPMTLECRVEKTLDESESGCYVIAKIENIAVDDRYLAADGKPDLEKMHLITYDPVHMGYLEIGQRVGNAFADGKALK